VPSENPNDPKPANHTDPKPSDKGDPAPELPPPAGIPPVEVPPAPHAYQITRKTEKDWRDKVKFWAELFGLGVLVVYTCFAGCQWKVANDTLTEIRNGKADTNRIITASETQAYAAQKIAGASDRNAAAAESFSTSAGNINIGLSNAVQKLEAQTVSSNKALQATIDNFHQEQRAWLNAQVAIGIPKSDVPYKIQIPILNSGKTPAKHLMVYFTGRFFAKGEKVAYTFLGVPQPLGIATPGPSITFTYNSTGIPETGDYVAAHKGDKFIVFGAITYEDVFDAKHWLTYCFFATEENSYAYCTEHNKFGDGRLPPDSLK
jgi:hypothetical protein